MATFAQSTFGHAQYALARPAYSQALYNIIFSYHKGGWEHCVDLGTGHGVVARAVSSRFTRVTGTDPSEGMLAQASALTPTTNFPNVAYVAGPAEDTSTEVGRNSTDMIVSAQAAHWFDYNLAWPDLARSLRNRGTIAFWGYGGLYFPNSEKATRIVCQYMGLEPLEDEQKPSLGPFWPQPGSNIVTNLYRDIIPPPHIFEDVLRYEYQPIISGNDQSRDQDWPLRLTLTIRDLEALMRSWSATHRWQEAHPECRPRQQQSRDQHGQGDIIDMLLDDIREVDSDWRDSDKELQVELPTGLLLARKK